MLQMNGMSPTGRLMKGNVLTVICLEPNL